MSFTVYSKPACPYCDQAKALLESKSADFEVIMLDVGQPKVERQQYISREDFLAEFPGVRTVPQITRTYSGATMARVDHIGGFAELKELFEQNPNAAIPDYVFGAQ